MWAFISNGACVAILERILWDKRRKGDGELVLKKKKMYIYPKEDGKLLETNGVSK